MPKSWKEIAYNSFDDFMCFFLVMEYDVTLNYGEAANVNDLGQAQT